MAYTTPPTFTSGTTATAADMNVLGDDIVALKSLSDGVTFSAVQIRRAASQSISDSSSTPISFDTENLDVGSWWASGTNVVVPAGAVPAGATTIGVLVTVAIKFAANTTGRRKVSVLKNGTSFGSWNIGAAGGGDPTDIVFPEMTTVAAADVITVEAYQTSGGALNVTECRLNVIRLGVAS